MNSEQRMHGVFSEIIITSFHNFLSKLEEQSDSPNFDGYFMNKLRDIYVILQKLFEKDNLSTSRVPSLEEIPAAPPKVEFEKGKSSTFSVHKRINTDNYARFSDVFERAEKYIRRDIEGDSSDCDSMCVSEKDSNDLFKTDYPNELFLDAKTTKEVSHPDAGSAKFSISDPYIRGISSDKNVGSNGDVKDQNDSHHNFGEKTSSISQLSKSDETLPHDGQFNQLKFSVQAKSEFKFQLQEDNSAWKYIRKIASIPHGYECTICEITISGPLNVEAHVIGRKHKHKLVTHV